ncbi:hypothetical protein [Natronocalculus amylovorans]|uniref:Uncharacterized protein n=1 Tax=Natronocalculus amylovorans TaxID=2917812 RepID=A0AAE3G0P9_9EURY|nr:hypothetical protein [Natronocalculus amylovorans]MCL9818388.1 hypothetical protein [Natronocalculus amylovorans]
MTDNEGSNGKEARSSDADVDLSQLALEEIRLRYQEESDRRTSVESKIGTVLTVDAIIVSVVSIFSSQNMMHYAAMAVALISVFNGIRALWVRDYHSPGLDIEDYLQYIDDPPKPIRRELVKSYLTVITGNEEADDPEMFFKGNKTRNDEKLEKLDQCLKLTAVSLTLVILHPVPGMI